MQFVNKVAVLRQEDETYLMYCYQEFPIPITEGKPITQVSQTQEATELVASFKITKQMAMQLLQTFSELYRRDIQPTAKLETSEEKKLEVLPNNLGDEKPPQPKK